MKYIIQFGYIAGITFVGEILSKVVPFPVPASIWGMIILFSCLLFNVIKEDAIKDTADFLLATISIMYLPISTKLMVQYTDMQDEIIPVLIITVVSTIVCFFVTAKVCEFIVARSKKNNTNKEEA